MKGIKGNLAKKNGRGGGWREEGGGGRDEGGGGGREVGGG